MKSTKVLWNSVLLIVSTALLIGCAPAQQEVAPSSPKKKMPVSKAISQVSKRVKGPYIIYKGKNTEMTLLWQGSETFESQVRWGKDTSYLLGSDKTTEYGDHQHTYTIKNLEPGTKYYYEVIMDGENFNGTFRAAPSESDTKLKFLVYGDTRSHPDVHNQVAAAMLSVYASDSGLNPLALNVGDLVKFGDVESQWQEQFFDAKYPKIQELLANISFQTTAGNHEMYGMNYKSADPELKRFKKYFPYPFVEHAYWSFDFGPAHIVMVDQNYYAIEGYELEKLEKTVIMRERAVRSLNKKVKKLEKRDTEKDRKKAAKLRKKLEKTEAELEDMRTKKAPSEQRLEKAIKIQIAWLEKDLASTKKPWKFLVMHQPGWSALGGHENDEAVQKFIQPLAEKYGVTAIFAGHNHYYARAVVNNIQHVTTGGGGAPFHKLDKEAPHLVVATKAHHFCKVEIDGNRLSFTALKPDGTVIDSFSIQH